MPSVEVPPAAASQNMPEIVTTPPTPNPSDRIIRHMNLDHSDSVTRYLEHYHGFSSWQARNARIVSFTLTHMNITTVPDNHTPSASNTYLVPFDPPLSKYGEARVRLVEMDQLCLEKLGRSPVTIKTYAPPKGASLVQAIVIACLFYLLHSRTALSPHVPPTQKAWYNWPIMQFSLRFPGAADYLTGIQPQFFWSLLAIHAVECVYLDRSRLRKHSVARGSSVWFQWMFGHLIEGFTSFRRFDKMVEAQEQSRQAKGEH